MSNVLNEEKKQQVIALGRLGWSLRRIEEATSVRRETASIYLKQAGVAVRPPRSRRVEAKPASSDEVTTDFGASWEVRRREQRLRKKLEGQALAKPQALPLPVARMKPVGTDTALLSARKVTGIAPSPLEGEFLQVRAGKRKQTEPALAENKGLIPFTAFGRGAAIIDLDTGKPATKAAILAGQLCLVQYGERSFTIRLADDGRVEARCPKCRQLCFRERSQVSDWVREHGCLN